MQATSTNQPATFTADESVIKVDYNHVPDEILADDMRLAEAAGAFNTGQKGIRDTINQMRKELSYELVYKCTPEQLYEVRRALQTLDELWHKLQTYSEEFEKREESKKKNRKSDDKASL